MNRDVGRQSMEALVRIAEWLADDRRRIEQTTLVGGWAVHSWSPYYFSMDIDLVVRSDTRDRLISQLKRWDFYPADPRAGMDRGKWLLDADGPQPIRIDLAGTGRRWANTFERDPRLELPWALAFEHRAPRAVSWNDPPLSPRMPVCNADLLLLYKLKALDDRGHLMRVHGDPDGYLATKIAKDAKDIWELLKEVERRPDLGLIREQFDRLPTLRETLRSAPKTKGVADAPSQGRLQEYKSLVEKRLGTL